MTNGSGHLVQDKSSLYLYCNLGLGEKVQLLLAFWHNVHEQCRDDLFARPQLLRLTDTGREDMETGGVLRKGAEHKVHVVLPGQEKKYKNKDYITSIYIDISESAIALSIIIIGMTQVPRLQTLTQL